MTCGRGARVASIGTQARERGSPNLSPVRNAETGQSALEHSGGGATAGTRFRHRCGIEPGPV